MPDIIKEDIMMAPSPRLGSGLALKAELVVNEQEEAEASGQ
jgi:hypothetical protein